MIHFTCSCGKSYQLQDRVAGRQVRCNQCQKTLLVPNQSQAEPIIPLEDRGEDSRSAMPQQIVTPQEASTMPTTLPPVITSPASSSPTPVSDSNSSADSTERPETWAASPSPNGVAAPLWKKQESRRVALILLSLFLVGILVVLALGTGLLIGFAGGSISEEEYADEKSRSTDIIASFAEQLHENSATEEGPLETALRFPAEEAVQATGEADWGRRIEAMKSLALSREATRESFRNTQRSRRVGLFLENLCAYIEGENQNLSLSFFDKETVQPPTADAWRIDDRGPGTMFDVQTADGTPILISLDGNPLDRQEKGVLDELAALTADDSVKREKMDHHRSLRIDSASSQTLRVLWPAEVRAAIPVKDVNQIRFCLYLSTKENLIFKPQKPKESEKVAEFSRFVLRFYTEIGFIEFAPIDMETLVRVCEQARPDWWPIRIPIAGDDTWKRTDYGVEENPVVRRIEFQADPTGEGVTFWLDNLGLAR